MVQWLFLTFSSIFFKMPKFTLSLQDKACLHTRFEKKDKISWLDPRMTFLYTSSVIVEELKAAVLSKTKPNKPEKQAEGLELSPSREVKLRAPAPLSLLCAQPPVQSWGELCQQWTPAGPEVPSQPQKALCLKADPNNCGILSHLLLWRNVREFLWFRFWFWFGFFVLFSLVLFYLVWACLFVGGVVTGFFSSHSCCKPPWFHHPEQGMFKAGCNCSEIAEEFGLAFTCRNLDNYSFFKCETFLYQCSSKLHEERQVCDTWWMLLNEYCYMIWGFFTQTWEYTSGFLAFFPYMNYWCFDYAGRSCWPSSSSADLCFALHISAA